MTNISKGDLNYVQFGGLLEVEVNSACDGRDLTRKLWQQSTDIF